MPPPNQPTTPIIGGQLKLSDLQEPGLPFLNAMLSQIQTQIQALQGAAGPTKLPAGVDVQGSTVTGIAPPKSPTDAVSSAHAEANYSAAALAPKLESGSRTALKTYRALNSKQQRENYTDFLEGALNTAPTTNTSTISGSGVVGGSVVVTVAAGSHLFPSGNVTPYPQRSDTISVGTPGVYYYFLSRGSQTLALSPPFTADTQQSRLSINADGTVLIAVASIDGSGLILNESAAGATPPATTGNFRLLTRL